MTRQILIQHGHIVTVDEDLGDVVDGDVLIEDGVIRAVGQHLHTCDPDAETIDARGRLVMPGMIDTHRHVWQEQSAVSPRR